MSVLHRIMRSVRMLFLLSVISLVLIDIVNSLAYDVAKLNTNMNKMKKTINRHNTREQSKVVQKVLLPKFVDKAKSAVGRLHEDEYTNGFATFELLVRRTQTGPWYRYQDLLGTEATNEYVENVISGGLEAESWRMKLDNWISIRIFGTGTGTESIKKVKDTLAPFKKLRPREFEFGYRIAIDGETVYSVEKSFVVEAVIPKSRSPSMARVNVTEIIANTQSLSSTRTQILYRDKVTLLDDQRKQSSNEEMIEVESTLAKNSISVLNDIVLKFYDKMISKDVNGCLFFSDGSATLSEDGLGCATACCGVYLLPTKDNIPIYEISENIRVNSAGGMIDSPFDAELIAGLSAVTLAKMIAETCVLNNAKEKDSDLSLSIESNRENLDEHATLAETVSLDADSNLPTYSVHKTSVKSNKIAFTLHTDSKTLTRAIRTGPKGDLADRASPSRLALWRLLSSHIIELDSMGLPMTVEWIPGHPERRDTDKSRWTVRDIGIWMADEIAKTETNEVTPGFIHRKSEESNNNKLEVRKTERIAKFPKKAALKSPKKSGVKKKSYYNTKLTFSKDPRNPNNIAAAAAIESADLSINDDISIDDDILSLAASFTATEVEQDIDNEVEVQVEEVVEVQIEVEETLEKIGEVVSNDDKSIDAAILPSDETFTLLDDADVEMEDVDVLEVTERVEDISKIEPIAMSVAIIEAADMIKLSALLSV